MKFFTTAGPVRPDDNYYVPLSARLNEQELYQLIEQKKYFALHAPRQTGKTSIILNFSQQLNRENKYTALYVNVESAQAARNDYIKGIYTILEEFLNRIKHQLPKETHIVSYLSTTLNTKNITGSSLKSMLGEWALHSTKPIVLFIDEIDSLVGDTLLSVLRQLRAGYDERPQAFPQSVCLVGVRDVRDYRIWSDAGQQMILGGSAFNIKAESLRLGDFTKEEVHDLYMQHTAQTGQKFNPDAIDYAFEVTQGQPWLVNALAYQACFRDVVDRSKVITKEVLERAKETLILRQDTHLDVLIDRLQESRVRRIIDAIINSEVQMPLCDDDDIKYAVDLGLIKVDSKNMKIANPIYQEIFPRVLAAKLQSAMSGQSVDYISIDGLIDMHKLLSKFTDFYRQNSAIWLEKFDYKEAGPHLILLAFLQRIVNGGGSIHREYALGRGRVDIVVTWKTQRIVIELKLFASKRTLPEGLQQLAGYMDVSHGTEGHLVIFDNRSTKSWDEKIYTKQEKIGNRVVTVWGV